MENNEIKVNKERLAEICLRAHKAYNQKNGVFRKGVKKYLPQWNLPPELEYSPQRTEVKDPKQAANYLWMLALLERRTLSRINIRNGLATWEDKDVRWIFNPLQAAGRNIQDLKDVFFYNLQYTLNDFAESYQENSIKLIEEYDGNPRKIIEGKSVEQAKRELMSFKGVGTGISNLFMIYLLDRKIASPTDVENCLVKVDVHKSRIPLNTNCIVTKEDEIREDKLVAPLENSYKEVDNEQNLNPLTLDAVLWIIGSKICAKRDYRACMALCPLEEMCAANTYLNRDSSAFVVHERDSTGKRIRVDTRKNLGQEFFSFFREFESIKET